MNFSKYQGAGNDFIILTSIKRELSKTEIAKLCDRRFGIGADGLICLKLNENRTIGMTYYNSDGLQGSFCGNGARCSVRAAQLMGWIVKRQGVLSFGKHSYPFEIVESGNIAINFEIHSKLKTWKDYRYIDTGSPHVVIEYEEEISNLDLEKIALPIRHHSDFKQQGGTNVNICNYQDDFVYMRTFERGVEAETYACGTGTIAVAMSFFEKPAFKNKSRLNIKALGGNLSVEKEDFTYRLIGPAEEVFRGVI